MVVVVVSVGSVVVVVFGIDLVVVVPGDMEFVVGGDLDVVVFVPSGFELILVAVVLGALDVAILVSGDLEVVVVVSAVLYVVVVDSGFCLVLSVDFGDLIVDVFGPLEVGVVVVSVDLKNIVAPDDLGVGDAVLGDLKLVVPGNMDIVVVPGNLETVVVPGTLVLVCDVIGDLAGVGVVVPCTFDVATTVSGVKVTVVPTCKTREDK